MRGPPSTRYPVFYRREEHRDFRPSGIHDVRDELLKQLRNRQRADRAEQINVNREWAMSMQNAASEHLPFGPDEF